MTTLKTIFRKTLWLYFVLFAMSCSATNNKSEIILIGSTPGDEPIRAMLKIPATTKVDFIRWNLTLAGDNSYVLDINYGESQPNTLGFKEEGEKQIFKGTYSVLQKGRFKEVYELKSDGLAGGLLIAKLTENIFHLLSSRDQLMVGNGGWSYTLNRTEPVHNSEILIPSMIPDSHSLQLIYDGRTPCREMAKQHPEMNATPSCFKIKWRLVLNKDSATHQPTTCSIRNIVNNEPRDILGSWEVIKGTVTNPAAIIYKIKVANLAEPILFLAADDNILFFLDKHNDPMIGNKDFSYTMNRKIEP